MSLSATDQLHLFCRMVTSLLTESGADLSLQQMLIFLICYLERDAQTTRKLATTLNMASPSVSRALRRLEQLQLVQRRIDSADRRRLLIQRRKEGWQVFENLNVVIAREVALINSVPSLSGFSP